MRIISAIIDLVPMYLLPASQGDTYGYQTTRSGEIERSISNPWREKEISLLLLHAKYLIS